MGIRMPETCWAVFKWQVINLRICCICLVDSVETSVYLYVACLSFRSAVLVTSDISGDSARCPAALTRSLQRPNSRLKSLHLEIPVSLSTDTPATRTVLLWVCWLPPVGAKFFLFISHPTPDAVQSASLNASQKSVMWHYRAVTCASQIFVYLSNNVWNCSKVYSSQKLPVLRSAMQHGTLPITCHAKNFMAWILSEIVLSQYPCAAII